MLPRWENCAGYRVKFRAWTGPTHPRGTWHEIRSLGGLDGIGQRNVHKNLHALFGVEAHFLIDVMALVDVLGPLHGLHEAPRWRPARLISTPTWPTSNARDAHGERQKKERYEDDCDADHDVAEARDYRLQRKLGIVARPCLKMSLTCFLPWYFTLRAIGMVLRRSQGMRKGHR